MKQVHKDSKGRSDRKDRKEMLDPKVFKVLPEQPDLKVLLVPPAPKVNEEKKAIKVKPD